MQSAVRHRAISQPVSASVQSLERAQSVTPAPRFGAGNIWRDALATFSAHAPSILFLTLIGFAGASLIGLGVSLALNLDQYVHASGPFATYKGINTIFAPDDTRPFVVLVMQGLLGWLLMSFARGAITHLALNDGAFGQACRCAFIRLPALLAGPLIYSALIGFGAVGVNVWLRDANLDLSNAGQKAVTVEGALQVTFIRSLNALIPDPGSPAAEFVPHWRHTSFKHLEHVADYNQKLLDAYGSAITGIEVPTTTAADESASSDESRHVIIACLLILFIGETLLRFRSVAAMRSLGIVASLLHSMWWGIRYFIPITIHIWALRLTILAFSLVFIIFPIVIVQCFADPTPAWTGVASSVVSLPLIVLAISLINSVLSAFGVVYDARLYRRLVEHPC